MLYYKLLQLAIVFILATTTQMILGDGVQIFTEVGT
jgi:hypothetical protein